MKQTMYAIDIETVSQGPQARLYTDNQNYALGNVKDPAKVEAKLKEKRAEAAKKHGLSWHLGKVVSVSIVDVFGESKSMDFYGHEEEKILKGLSVAIRGCRLIGKSSKTFDFPFLVGRYMALEIPVPNSLKERAFQYDVDEFFGYSAASGQRGKLADYAWGISADAKYMHGSQVQDLYDLICGLEIADKNDEAVLKWIELVKYNRHDSDIVADMARRYYGDGGVS